MRGRGGRWRWEVGWEVGLGGGAGVGDGVGDVGWEMWGGRWGEWEVGAGGGWWEMEVGGRWGWALPLWVQSPVCLSVSTGDGTQVLTQGWLAALGL